MLLAALCEAEIRREELLRRRYQRWFPASRELCSPGYGSGCCFAWMGRAFASRQTGEG